MIKHQPQHASRLSLPPSMHHLPKRRFQLDHHSEYYKQDRQEMKQCQMVQFREWYSNYSNIIIFDMDRVRGSMLMELRREIRFLEMGELLVAKNTVIIRIIKEMKAQSLNETECQALEELSKHMHGSICLLFTNGNCLEVKRFIESKVTFERPKPGDKILEDYYIEPYLTHLDPTRTSFFAALNVATKISKGSIEIINRPLLLRKGELVGHSEYALLVKLELKPFKIGLKALYVFDRENYCIYDEKMLDYNLNHSVYEAMYNVGAITMECNLENQISVLIALKKGIHDLLALESEIENCEKKRTIENDDVD